MNHRPKMTFFPLCDLHHSPMQPVLLEGPASEEARLFHRCERRDCHRIFRDGYGYVDFAEGQFDPSRSSRRECPLCKGTLYLAEVDHALKVETWECAQMECNHSEEIPSPSSR